MNKKEITSLIEKILGPSGRIISYSKSIYMYDNADNFIIFNANIFTKEDGKVWHGDLDITKEDNNLKKISQIINKDLYILNENYDVYNKYTVNLSDALYIIKTDKTEILNKDYERIKNKIQKKLSLPDNVEKAIRFNSMTQFRSNKKTSVTPLVLFYDYIRKELKLKDLKDININRIALSVKDYHILTYLLEEWFLKNEKLHIIKLKQLVYFEMFNHGPIKLENVDSDHIYILKC